MAGESFILMVARLPRYYLLNLLMVTIFIQPKI